MNPSSHYVGLDLPNKILLATPATWAGVTAVEGAQSHSSSSRAINVFRQGRI